MIEALALLATAYLGILFVSIFAPIPSQWKTTIPISWPLGLAAGLGLTSCTYFLALSAGLSHTGLVLMEAGLFAALFALQRNRKPPMAYRTREQPGSWQSWALGSLAIALIVAGVACIVLIFENPQGSWDAVAIWNDRARFLYRGRAEGLSVFSTQSVWTHPDYPLLLPGSTARLWEWVGGESAAAPIVLGLAATTATLALLFSALQHLRCTKQAILAACAAVSTSFFVVNATHQMADILVALYILASLVLYCLSETTSSGNRRLLVLSGAMAGFCAWTKNEGLLFALSLLVSLLMFGGRSRIHRLRQAEWAPFSAGLLPVLVVVMLFKSLIDTPNDIVSSLDPWRMGSLLLAPSRYYLIVRQAMITLFLLDGWPNLVPVLLVYAWLVGPDLPRNWRRMSSVAAGALGIVITGYVTIYVITPHSLVWHLSRSSSRVFLQLWPSMLFVAFLVLRSAQKDGKSLFEPNMNPENAVPPR